MRDFIADAMELAGLGDPLGRWNLTEHATAMTMLAQESRDAAAALDSILGIYGQIDAMGQRMSAAGGIADALFGEGGDPWDGVGPLRDVFDAGLISVEQFNSAIEDGIAIQERAVESELYLNKIRADQLPVLRETTDAYAALIEEIAGLDPQDQLVALGWLDDGMQAQVQNFTDLVAQMNNFGDAGQDAIQGVIDRIAATDPVLTAMLEDLGLIEQQMDGSYTLSIDAGDAISDMERLTRSIDALTEALGGTPPTYDVDVRTSVNGEATGPEGIAGLLTNALGNVTGGEAGIDVPVRPSLPDNAADDLRNALSVEPIEVEISPVIKGGASGIGDAVGGALDWLGSGGGAEGTTVTIDAVDNATPILTNVQAAVDAIPASVTIWTLVAGWTESIGYLNGVQAAADAIPASVTTWTLVANSTEAIGQLNGVRDAATEIPDSTTTWTLVAGADGAIAQLNAVRDAANAIPTSVTVSISAIGGYAAGASLGNSVLAGARDALGIASPSREFEEVGMWSAAGFERGWENHHHDPSIGFNVDTPNYGAGFGGGTGGGGVNITIADGAITVNAETNADPDEIAVAVADRITPAITSAVYQRRDGFGGVQA